MSNEAKDKELKELKTQFTNLSNQLISLLNERKEKGLSVDLTAIEKLIEEYKAKQYV